MLATVGWGAHAFGDPYRRGGRCGVTGIDIPNLVMTVTVCELENGKSNSSGYVKIAFENAYFIVDFPKKDGDLNHRCVTFPGSN